ncbi:MAG: phosphate ABC transporter substrate-binding protein PstS [Phycisphaerales bacterium]|nr:phosphate ABC transporter substrate-binding protein PstS [Phycisphaerales bacterium]
MSILQRAAWVSAVGVSIVVGGQVASAGEVRLGGAGATFPAPLYTKWVAEYEKVNPSVKIDYRSIGSGGGVKSITDKTVAFGASDAPLNKKEIDAMGGEDKVVQFPAVIGGVVPAYNLPGVKETIKFSGDVLADIFLGKISSWDDPRLQELNSGVNLPKLAITPAFRTDGSGTTHVFTSYLATQSPTFKGEVGAGNQVKWPLGQGGKGNEGVAAVIQQTAGSIGYIEQNYAVANKIAYGSVKNKAGQFILATPDTMSLAGDGAAATLKGTILRADIWDQPGEKTYPISAFTYIILYKDLSNIKTADEAKALVSFLKWATSSGQSLATQMDYAPLSDNVRKAVDAAIASLTHDGKPVQIK